MKRFLKSNQQTISVLFVLFFFSMDFIHTYLSLHLLEMNRVCFSLYYFLKYLSSDWKPYIHTARFYLFLSFSLETYFLSYIQQLLKIVSFFDGIIFFICQVWSEIDIISMDEKMLKHYEKKFACYISYAMSSS